MNITIIEALAAELPGEARAGAVDPETYAPLTLAEGQVAGTQLKVVAWPRSTLPCRSQTARAT